MANEILTRQVISSLGANNATGVATVTQDVEIDTSQFGTLNYEIRITGTPTGALTLEGTNQQSPSNSNKALASAFFTLPATFVNPALPAVAGAAVNYSGDLVSGIRFVRIKYVNSASAGTLDVYVNATQP
jgi:hypothetical protein